jgi:hypothetical protein
MNHPQLAPGQPPKSGGVLKWILLGCGGLLLIGAILIGVSVYLVSRSFNTDPGKVEAVAQEIVTFEKPAGYKGAFSMSMMGMTSAVLVAGPDGSGGTIVFSVIPAAQGSQEQFEKQLKASLEKQGQNQEVTEQRKAETFKVRGRDVTAQVGVVSPKGSEARSLQYTITFEGGSGKTVMLMVSGPEQTTDHAWVQKFLDTVK